MPPRRIKKYFICQCCNKKQAMDTAEEHYKKTYDKHIGLVDWLLIQLKKTARVVIEPDMYKESKTRYPSCSNKIQKEV